VRVVDVFANYSRSPLGSWHVEVSSDEGRTLSADAGDIHAAFEAAIDLIQAVGEGSACTTVHALDGDVRAFAELANEHGLEVPADRGASVLFWD
jgi:hypothetical protein